MDYETSAGYDYFTKDPVWAEDFAPNGKLASKWPLQLYLQESFARNTPETGRHHDQETICEVGTPFPFLSIKLTILSTLEQIADYGSRSFYEGEIGMFFTLEDSSKLTFPANYTIAALSKENGTMTLEDLKNYEVSIRKTVSINYRGYKVFSVGTPSSGAVALSMLKIIEGYNMSDPERRDLDTHLLDEAMKYSYAARGELGDPDFFSYMDGFEAKMLTSKTAESIRERISDDHTRDPTEYNPKCYLGPENHGTSHVVTADASGMSITLTSTVNLLFGSHLMVPETGRFPLSPSGCSN